MLTAGTAVVISEGDTLVDRDLRFARAWLRQELAPEDETGGADGA